MPERIREAVRRSGARYADLRWERSEGTRVVSRSRTLERLESVAEEGGIVRVLAPGGGWGSASVSSLDDIGDAVAVALAAARAAGPPEVTLGPVEAVQVEKAAELDEDFRRVPLAAKRDVLDRLEDVLLGHRPRVRDSRVAYGDSFRSVWFASSEGSWVHVERPLIELELEAIAAAGGVVQSARENLCRARGFAFLLDQGDLAREAAERAESLLEARPVAAGVYTVVTDPVLTGVLVHEALGQVTEADRTALWPHLSALLGPGREIGPAFLEVAEGGPAEAPDPAVPDDEGVGARRTVLVQRGVLSGRVHSRETAALAGEEPTGGAHAESGFYPPLVRLTRVAVEPGAMSPSGLFEGVWRGLYCRGARSAVAASGRFAVAVEEAFLVRDGQLAERVRDVVLGGDVFQALRGITAVADDFKLEERLSSRKDGQVLPVRLGGPHLRIEGLLVGGWQG